MKQMVTVAYPPAVLSPNCNKSRFVKGPARKKYKQACMWECIAQKIKKMKAPIRVTITIVYPGLKRGRDFDNAISSFKHGQDGVAAYIGVDDKHWRTKYKEDFSQQNDADILAEQRSKKIAEAKARGETLMLPKIKRGLGSMILTLEEV